MDIRPALLIAPVSNPCKTALPTLNSGASAKYSKVSGISGFGYKRRGWCQISGSGISVRGGVGRFGYKLRTVYSAPSKRR